MTIRGAWVLVLLLIPVAAASTATIGSYTAELSIDPLQPVVGKPVNLRITIRGPDGQVIPDFTAEVNVYRTTARAQDEFVYHLEGTYPTSDLLIPYQFQQSGAHWVVVDIPGANAVQDGTLGFAVLPQTIGEQPPLRTRENPSWLAVAIALLAFIAVLCWRDVRRR